MVVILHHPNAEYSYHILLRTVLIQGVTTNLSDCDNIDHKAISTDNYIDLPVGGTTQLSVQGLAVYVEPCKNKTLNSRKKYTDLVTLVAGGEYPEIS